MAINFAKVSWISMETLRLFKNKLAIAANMRTDYEKDFRKEYAVGDTIQVKYPWRPLVTDGIEYNPQGMDRITTTVTVDTVKGIHFDFGTIDKLLNMERGEEKVRKEYLSPAATQLAQAWDSLAALYAYQHSGNIVGVLGTNPTTFDATSAAARQRMVELACPADGDHNIYVPPAVMRAIKGGSDANLSRFGPVDEIKTLYKKGVVGTADGFEWYESMSLKNHTAGTWGGAVSLASAVANGATSLSVTCTNGDTFKKGDVIGIAGVYAVNPSTRDAAQKTTTMTVSVAADVTASGTSATVTINEPLYYTGPYQNIDSQPAASATLTLFPGTSSPNGKSGKQALALHGDAFAFVSLPLPMPEKEELVSQTTDPDTGISIAFIRSFDPIQRRWINRFDTIGGFGMLYPQACSVRVLCQ